MSVKIKCFTFIKNKESHVYENVTLRSCKYERNIYLKKKDNIILTRTKSIFFYNMTHRIMISFLLIK